MRFQIVTIANAHPSVTHPHADYFLYDEFLATARKWGHEPLVLGWGEPWGGLGTKPRTLKRAIDSGAVTGDVILFADAFDVIFASDPGEVARDARDWLVEQDKGIVFNAEKACFPQSELCEQFPDPGTPYRYLNSGVSIGDVESYARELDAMGASILPDDFQNDDGQWTHFNDQFNWQEQFVKSDRIALDSRCRFFQTLSDCVPGEFDLDGDRLVNRETETTPGVIHANGGSKTGDCVGPILAKLGLK